ncbi:MAG: gephyrin-like molybdotransferase Glp [Christiangramia sp.]|uniref:molybdopterin molybdotransferase MoeA n=1 Tax=Christiangramia sp. TaxID=1931228 RepID=UPI003242719D
MLKIEEALQIINDQQIELSTEIRKLSDSLGFAVSSEIRAPFDMPAFDNSAMDGYALCGISKEYQIIGEVAAGDDHQFELKQGEAVRIFTGARVPAAASAVMMQEKTRVEGEKLFLDELPKEGQSIRKKGGELQKEQLVFDKGYTITPAGIGMIGALGMDQVEVFKKPIINLITTGNELVQPGKAKGEGQIYESNSFAISAAAENFGFPVHKKHSHPDDFEQIKTGISEALEQADILLLSGGISVGDHDFVKQALEENGMEQQFYKVFQKPGKPLYFGRKANKFVFALPGNPASSLSCFYIYVLPFLQQFSGFQQKGLPKFQFPLKEPYHNRSDRPSFLKAKIENDEVRILDGQASSMILSMAHANALAFIDAETNLQKGDLITCYLIG